MKKDTKDMVILGCCCLFVAMPDIIPVFGDCIDAGIMAFLAHYFKGEEKFPGADDDYDEQVAVYQRKRAPRRAPQPRHLDHQEQYLDVEVQPYDVPRRTAIEQRRLR